MVESALKIGNNIDKRKLNNLNETLCRKSNHDTDNVDKVQLGYNYSVAKVQTPF